MKPIVECEKLHPGLACDDVAAAVDFYTTKLAFELGFSYGADFAGVNLGEVQVFLQKGVPNPSAAAVYFVVGDADELYEYHRANGVEIATEIGDRDYGLRDYSVKDINGYDLTFGHYTYTFGEPITIERVHVPLRLEKRLAALMRDLAAYKHLSFDSMMEETLLHTMDGVGPHTKAQLRYIEELKQKHGIDYDSHGSYRFKE